MGMIYHGHIDDIKDVKVGGVVNNTPVIIYTNTRTVEDTLPSPVAITQAITQALIQPEVLPQVQEALPVDNTELNALKVSVNDLTLKNRALLRQATQFENRIKSVERESENTVIQFQNERVGLNKQIEDARKEAAANADSLSYHQTLLNETQKRHAEVNQALLTAHDENNRLSEILTESEEDYKNLEKNLNAIAQSAQQNDTKHKEMHKVKNVVIGVLMIIALYGFLK